MQELKLSIRQHSAHISIITEGSSRIVVPTRWLPASLHLDVWRATFGAMCFRFTGAGEGIDYPTAAFPLRGIGNSHGIGDWKGHGGRNSDLQKKSNPRKGGESTVSTVSTDSVIATALTNQNLAEYALLTVIPVLTIPRSAWLQPSAPTVSPLMVPSEALS